MIPFVVLQMEPICKKQSDAASRPEPSAQKLESCSIELVENPAFGIESNVSVALSDNTNATSPSLSGQRVSGSRSARLAGHSDTTRVSLSWLSRGSCHGRCGAFCIFIVTITIFFFILSALQAVYPDPTPSWLDATLLQSIFYLAVAASCAHFALMASIPPTWWRRYGKQGYYRMCVSLGNLVLSTSIFVMLAHDAHLPMNERLFVRKLPTLRHDVDRGGCVRIKNILRGKDLSFWSNVCPKLSGDEMQSKFATVHPLFTQIDIREKMSKLKDLLRLYNAVLYGNDPQAQFCNEALLEIQCNATFSLCREIDCSPQGYKPCELITGHEPRLTDNVAEQLVDKCSEYFSELYFKTTNNEGKEFSTWLDQDEKQIVVFLMDTFLAFSEYMEARRNHSSAKCGTMMDRKHRVSNSPLTCNPQIEKYFPNVEQQLKTDLSSLWIIALSLLSMFVFTFGNVRFANHWNASRSVCRAGSQAKNEKKEENGYKEVENANFLRLNMVRLGTATIGVLTGLLVLIGAFHLQKMQGSSQRHWSGVYFFVSWLSMHGGLYVLTLQQSKRILLRRRKSNDPDCLTICVPGSCRFFRHTATKKCAHILLTVKKDFWDPGGAYFPLKVALLEVGDIVVQLSGLFGGARLDDAVHVSISSVVIGANLVVLGVTIIICYHLSNSESASLGATLIVEVFFDKIYVGIAIFLRFDTISNPDLDFWSQTIQHLTILVPGVLTALDMKDALYLSDHVESPSRHNDQQSSLKICRFLNTKNPHFLKSFFLLYLPTISMISFGLFLSIYAGVKYQIQRESCRQVIGNIATCARPRLYFKEGFWGPTTCAWEDVKSFNCSQTMSDVEKGKIMMLPDAEDAYRMMSSLVSIDISFADHLENIPTGWASIPTPGFHNPKNLSIRAENCSRLRSVPYKLCTRPLESLVLGENTAAAKVLNWSGQLSGGRMQLNSACQNAWKMTLQKIYLANNNLSCWQGIYKKQISNSDPVWAARSCSFDDISKLEKLTLVDLSRNNISRITGHMVKILRNVPIEITNNSHDHGLILLGNPIKSLTVYATDGMLTSGWLQAIKPANSYLSKLNIRASPIYGKNGEGVKALSQALQGSKVRSLALDAVHLGEEGTVNLLPGLMSTSRTLEEIYLSDTLMKTSELEMLLKSSKISKARWKKLHLNGNILNASGRIVADYFEANPYLEVLSLRDSRMKQEDCELIGSSLPKAQRLVHLTLSCDKNYRDGRILSVIAKSLPISALQRLNLYWHLFEGEDIFEGEDHILALANALSRTNLTYLSFNCVESKMFFSLKRILLENRTNVNAQQKRILVEIKMTSISNI